jgi:hypothetical protein
MNAVTVLAPLLERFFTQRLMQERRVSPHTISSSSSTCSANTRRMRPQGVHPSSGNESPSICFDTPWHSRCCRLASTAPSSRCG